MEAIWIFAIISVIVNLIKASNKSETNKQRRKTKPFASPPFTPPIRDSSRVFDSEPSKTIKKTYEIVDFEENNQIGSLNFRQEIKPYYSEEYDTSGRDKVFSLSEKETGINLNELQRAVIMAEVLGKPKALRK